MIQVDIQGRLGNHFFQYAMAYASSKSLKTTFRIRKWSQSDLSELCMLGSLNTKLNRPSSTFASKFCNKVIDKLYNSKKVVEIDDFKNFIPEDNMKYLGYFQSDQYFKGFENEIRKEFTFRPEHLSRFKRTYSSLFEGRSILAVHIRRGDYMDVNIPHLGTKGLELPLNYYKNNIEKLKEENTLVVFASDDIEMVKKEFGQNENYIFSQEDKFLDFILLANANQLILSNSSFSWWAGFLNEKADKIIAPKFYLGFKVNTECPKGIMYEGFDWVDVFK